MAAEDAFGTAKAVSHEPEAFSAYWDLLLRRVAVKKNGRRLTMLHPFSRYLTYRV